MFSTGRQSIVTSKAQRGKTQRFQIAGWRWSQKNAPHTFIYNRITIIFQVHKLNKIYEVRSKK